MLKNGSPEEPHRGVGWIVCDRSWFDDALLEISSAFAAPHVSAVNTGLAWRLRQLHHSYSAAQKQHESEGVVQ
jgi:hypothetical protein